MEKTLSETLVGILDELKYQSAVQSDILSAIRTGILSQEVARKIVGQELVELNKLDNDEWTFEEPEEIELSKSDDPLPIDPGAAPNEGEYWRQEYSDLRKKANLLLAEKKDERSQLLERLSELIHENELLRAQLRQQKQEKVEK